MGTPDSASAKAKWITFLPLAVLAAYMGTYIALGCAGTYAAPIRPWIKHSGDGVTFSTGVLVMPNHPTAPDEIWQPLGIVLTQHDPMSSDMDRNALGTLFFPLHWIDRRWVHPDRWPDIVYFE